MRMSELADGVLLSRSGLTRLVDRLERDGLVRREACPATPAAQRGDHRRRPQAFADARDAPRGRAPLFLERFATMSCDAGRLFGRLVDVDDAAAASRPLLGLGRRGEHRT